MVKKAIAKLEEGDVREALWVLSSKENLAPKNEEDDPPVHAASLEERRLPSIVISIHSDCE